MEISPKGLAAVKHTLTAKVRAEDREKKSIEGLMVVKDELWVVKEEF